MTPYKIKMSSLQRGVRPILTNVADLNENSPASTQKFVRFASQVVDNELNESKTNSSEGRQKNIAVAANVTDDLKRKRIPSSSEMYKAGSSRHDLSLTQIQFSHHRTIQEKPMEPCSQWESEAQNVVSFQDRQFNLVAANTPTQYPPRVPSPPVNRDPPLTPRPERLPTPDFEETCDDRPNFCDCLSCYEAERSRRTAESTRGLSAYSKMEGQCEIVPQDQAATAYIRDSRPIGRQQRQDLAVGPTEDFEVWNLMRMGYPRSVAITALEACRYDFNKAVAFLKYNY
ncbi:hypothetical protein NHQ30_002995 [Ciborinia camelliae]|nr:hypothetical protein NHQ30_002995 [Ciborinia camelliae]